LQFVHCILLYEHVRQYEQLTSLVGRQSSEQLGYGELRRLTVR
jgi:hypothetical protein